MGKQPHILSSFESALEHSNQSVVEMACTARRNLDNAIRGLLDGNEALCNDAIADDEEVNNYQRVIDEDAMKILLRFQPVAADLRTAVSAMRVSMNLERISDLAETIARRARKIIKKNSVEEVKLIEPVYRKVSKLLHDTIRSYSDGDVALALELCDRILEHETLQKKTIKKLAKKMEIDTENLRIYLHLIFIARCLGSVGVHSVNIAEETIYIEDSTDLRFVSSSSSELEME